MAEVRLIIEKHRAVLTLIGKGDKVVDEEVWVFPSPMPRAEADDAAKDTFDDTCDYMNFMVHGLTEPPPEST